MNPKASLIIGIICISFSPIFVKLAGVSPLGAAFYRVVVAWLEPPVFAPGGGAVLLHDAGVTVVEIPDLAARARAINAAVLGH